MNAIVQIKDIQFANFIILHELDLPPDITQKLIAYQVEIAPYGEPNTVVCRDSSITIHNPSSVLHFLFHTIFGLLQKYVHKDIYKDKLGLGLFHMCKQYVYADFDIRKENYPPVLIGFSKIPIPTFIIKNIIEPIYGNISLPNVFNVPCKFTDTCRIIKSAEQLSSQYQMPRTSIPYDQFPVILQNTSVHNQAAAMSHLLSQSLEFAIGHEQYMKIMKTILYDDTNDLLANLILILNTLGSEPDFTLNFLQYLYCKINTPSIDKKMFHTRANKILENNALLKTADTWTPQVFKQWTQWSMLMGLIEKQLGPMRGSMWPATESIKPHEDEVRKFQQEQAKKRGKNQLNFEELLETYRETFNHKAIEPGKIIEHMLKTNRVW